MPCNMLIDATHEEETRVVVTDGDGIIDFDFESASRRPLTGNIYLARVTRVEPALQAAFVEYGSNRHGFLAYSEIHPDYYIIPVADRQTNDKPKSEPRESSPGEDVASTGGAHAETRALDSSGSLEIVEVESSSEWPDNSDIEGMSVVDSEPGETGLLDDADSARGDANAGRAASSEPGVEADADKASEPDEGDAARRGATETQKRPKRHSNGSKRNSGRRSPQFNRNYKIQEVIRVNQILLVQITKEERGNKGAALTTYISLAGRYCVLMPNTARGGGISRKITNPAHRKKLKTIADDIDVKDGAGLIIRTAGAQRTRQEIRRDNEFLMRQWDEIRELTLKSIAPAPIFEEGDLIKRSIRDIYSKDIDQVIVEGERGYRTAKDFMKMIMPSHARKVKQHTGDLPLFMQQGIEDILAGMFDPVVQLPSGGYIVIDTTEALVAIDVNSGRATRQGSVEQTALKTNLEAAVEIANQLRLRDLAGLIVIDFIDMEDRRNNAAVEKCFRDSIRRDRSRVQTGRISEFGLFEMSRQRLRSGMVEATTSPCQICNGTGSVRSDTSVALAVLREMTAQASKESATDLRVRAPISAVNYLLNEKRDSISAIEAKFGRKVRIEADPALILPEFVVEELKGKIQPASPDNVVSMTRSARNEPAKKEFSADEPKQKRRRRRRGKSARREDQDSSNSAAPASASLGSQSSESSAADSAPGDEDSRKDETIAKPPLKKKGRKASRVANDNADATAAKPDASAALASPNQQSDAASTEMVETRAEPRKKPGRPRRKGSASTDAEPEPEPNLTAESIELPAEEKKPTPRKPRSRNSPKRAGQASATGASVESIEGAAIDAPAAAASVGGASPNAENLESSDAGATGPSPDSRPPAKKAGRRSRSRANSSEKDVDSEAAPESRAVESSDTAGESRRNFENSGQAEAAVERGIDGGATIEAGGDSKGKEVSNSGRRGWWHSGRTSS